jgi:ABC-2 type transport system permease protein
VISAARRSSILDSGVSVVMLVAGFLLYAALFTVAGTLASTAEEAQSAAWPMYAAMWGAYAAVFFVVMPSPGGIAAQILSFAPPTAPFIVPARIAIGEMAAWQVGLSVALTLAGALVAVKLAGRLYAASLLSGGKLTWPAGWRTEPIR